jgi:hypothetical protein
MFVALAGEECLGMVCALRKPYRIAGQLAHCLEVFDWHSLPGLRGSGVGIRVMRAMMKTGERVISFGGTPDVLKTLPAMGWRRMCAMRMFELPLAGEGLLPALRRRLSVRFPGERVLLGGLAAGWFRPRRRAIPQGGRVVSGPLSDAPAAVPSLYEDEERYTVVQVPDSELLQWISAPGLSGGTFAFLSFMVGDQLRGWAMTRLYESRQGLEGAILDVYGRRADVALYTWMVSEAASLLAAAGPRMIRARASCPVLRAAFRANRFIEGQVDIPVHTWPPMAEGQAEAHITLNHADEPLRPYAPSAALEAVVSE